MAGQGYKLFNTGDVLTAQQVNEYLMQQTVMVFANAAARTTALSGILAEGLVSYLKDTDVVEIYTGAAWVSLDDPNAIQNSLLTTTGDIIYASAANTPARRAIGTTGQILTVSGGLPTWATPASGTLSWTSRIDYQSNTFVTIGYNGSNLYVAAGSNGMLYSSADGITWTSRTSGFGAQSIQKVLWVSSLSLWIAGGTNGVLTTSPDGTTWTARTANFSTNTIRDIFAVGSTVVAVGDGGGATNTGGIIYSTDGTTWTRVSMTPTIGTAYRTVTNNGTNWLVGADGSTNNYLYASTPSGTWTAGVIGAGTKNISVMVYDGTRTFITSSIGDIWYSTSATLGTVTNTTQSYNTNYPTMQNSAYYNGRFYFWQGSASFILQDYSTTPSTITSNRLANEGNEYNYPGGARAINITAYWVGAAGRIISHSGGIYTTF